MSQLLRHIGIVLFLFVPLVAATALPASATNDPYQILRNHYQAIGGLERLKNLQSSYAAGRIRHDRLQGRFESWAAPPLRYRLEEDYQIINQREGDDGSQRWQQDTNGQLLIDRDPETAKRRQIEKRLARYEHLDKGSKIFTLKSLGVTEIDGQLCDRIELSNSINSDVSQFFIEQSSRLLRKSIVQQPDFKLTTSYADFRDVDGFIVPFYEKTLIAPWNKEEEVWVERYQIDLPVDAELFAPPQERADDFRFPDGVSFVEIPFLFSENMLYLPVCFGEDCRYWTLDSGASMSVIDADYAERLGFEAQGEIRGHGFGEQFALSFVEVSGYRVGEVSFESQKIYVSQGLTERSYEPEVAGILGYDFLSRFVVEIDYAAQSIRFHDPAGFRYSGAGQVFAAPLKYRTFQLPASIDGLTGQWSLDLGSHRSSLLYPFAEKHDLLNKPGIETVSQGLVGLVFKRVVAFDELRIGEFTLPDLLLGIPVEKGAGASALGEISGYLGNSTLRHFKLILDYPHQQVVLEPGRDFSRRFPRDGSGMLIGMSEENQPMVSFVARQTPAESAGFVAGDRIEQVNGQPVGDLGGVVPLQKLLRQQPGTRHRFIVRRGETTLPLDIELQNLHPLRPPATAQ